MEVLYIKNPMNIDIEIEKSVMPVNSFVRMENFI